jgi:hypothetical protein
LVSVCHLKTGGSSFLLSGTSFWHILFSCSFWCWNLFNDFFIHINSSAVILLPKQQSVLSFENPLRQFKCALKDFTGSILS